MRMARLGFEASFKVAFAAGHAQAAEMTIRPGGSEGGPDNRHRGADQWLYVVQGRGEATVEGRQVPLQAAPCSSSNAARRTRSAIPATSRCRP